MLEHKLIFTTSKISASLRGAGLALAGAALMGLATPAGAKSPKKAKDESWITVSGTIEAATPSRFSLDYGDGRIGVEMDDFDDYGEGRALLKGDRVVVTGRVDHDAFEAKTIEASSVYVKGLGTQFYASPLDDEAYAAWTIKRPVTVGDVELTGRVASTVGREFTVDTGDAALQVDTVALGYNPMDDEGFQKIEVGDVVKVGGRMDPALFDELELSADWIVELSD